MGSSFEVDEHPLATLACGMGGIVRDQRLQQPCRFGLAASAESSESVVVQVPTRVGSALSAPTRVGSAVNRRSAHGRTQR